MLSHQRACTATLAAVLHAMATGIGDYPQWLLRTLAEVRLKGARARLRFAALAADKMAPELTAVFGRTCRASSRPSRERPTGKRNSIAWTADNRTMHTARTPMPTPKPSVRLLVLDLDNTLYDWVTFFVLSFREMLNVASGQLGISVDQLAAELKVVHQRHHNSEHPFALLETATVQQRFGHLSRQEQAKAMDEAFHAFNSKRKESLRLYPGVESTLSVVRESGGVIVGHTEATVPNALFRLRFLGIADSLRKLYAVQPSGEGHPDPARAKEWVVDSIALPVRFLAQNERKPDPRVLLDICSDFAIAPGDALYVGDSISRDIGMAREAGTRSAWAKYGTAYDRGLWSELVRVTHWTAEDVARAEAAREKYGDTEPDVVLETSLDEIVTHFDFESAEEA